jgi:hypothetical protein
MFRSVERSDDYQRVLGALDGHLEPGRLGAAILTALAARYESVHGECALHEFEQSGAVYLFDLASTAGLAQEDRTVAAWAVTPAAVKHRDVSYQRGYPMPACDDGRAVDRGHLIPHLSGGEFGPNIFRQVRALNRGWYEDGKRYRSLEREAATTPGTFYFGYLIYIDDSAYPSETEIGLLRGPSLIVERFNNRPED